jgi:hypothetical protein
VMQKSLQKLEYVPDLSTWQILGPFPTGMREQDFGADPLEAFGKIVIGYLCFPSMGSCSKYSYN